MREAATQVDPRLWVNAPLSLSARLAPLVAWLDGLLTQGVVAKGDHICYSADDDSNNIPLHYLGFRGGLLLDWFSVSRVHSGLSPRSRAEPQDVPRVLNSLPASWSR